MYAAKPKGRDGRLNFVVSGMLWQRSLVMQDVETKTLWSHILGKAMDGALKGARLEVIPSTMTDWASWQKRHPATEVVNYTRTAKRFTREFYRSPEKFVLGLEVGDAVKAYPFPVLIKVGALNDVVAAQNVVIAFDEAGSSANAFARMLPGREGEAQFSAIDGGRMRDDLSGTIWDRQSGMALSGELKGQSLERLPGIPSYRDAWGRFHPRSAYYGE